MSVLPKNKQLVFSIGNCIRDTSEICSLSLLVKISLTSFLYKFFRLVFFYFRNMHSYLCNKKKITHWFEHMKFIFSWKKKFHLFAALTLEIFFHSKINFISLRHRVMIGRSTGSPVIRIKRKTTNCVQVLILGTNHQSARIINAC